WPMASSIVERVDGGLSHGGVVADVAEELADVGPVLLLDVDVVVLLVRPAAGELDLLGLAVMNPSLLPSTCTCMYYPGMRTTIEIKREHRARLLELAARRGHKGFSKIVEEALDAYLKGQAAGTQTRKRARLLQGALSAKEARALRDATVEIRASWR